MMRTWTCALLCCCLLLMGMAAQAEPTAPPVAYEQEGNDDHYTATEMPLPHDSSMGPTAEGYCEGRLASDDDRDWYMFSLDEPAVLTLSFSHPIELERPDGIYYMIRLFESDGDTLAGGSEGWWPIGGEPELESAKLGLSAGTYFIELRSHAFYSAEQYTLGVSLDFATPSERESNAIRQLATQLSPGQPVRANLGSEDDMDWFMFALDEPGAIDVHIQHPQQLEHADGPYYKVRLFEADGETQAGGTDDGWWIYGAEEDWHTDTIGLKPGTYFVCVREAVYFSDDDYTLTVDVVR